MSKPVLRINPERTEYEFETPSGLEYGPMDIPDGGQTFLDEDTGITYFVSFADADGLQKNKIYELIETDFDAPNPAIDPVVTEIGTALLLTIVIFERLTPHDAVLWRFDGPLLAVGIMTSLPDGIVGDNVEDQVAGTIVDDDAPAALSGI